MAATCSVFLNVHDIQKSLGFYRALGFRVLKEYRDDETGETAYADLALEGAELGLGNIGSNDDPSYREWVSTPLGAGVIVYLTVKDVDRYHRAAVDSGAVIEQPLTDRPYGRLFTMNDPDGYTISFIRDPPSTKKAARAPAKKAGKTAKKAAKAPKTTAKAAKKAAGASAPRTAKKAVRKAPAKKAAGRGTKAARGGSSKRVGR